MRVRSDGKVFQEGRVEEYQCRSAVEIKDQFSWNHLAGDVWWEEEEGIPTRENKCLNLMRKIMTLHNNLHNVQNQREDIISSEAFFASQCNSQKHNILQPFPKWCNCVSFVNFRSFLGLILSVKFLNWWWFFYWKCYIFTIVFSVSDNAVLLQCYYSLCIDGHTLWNESDTAAHINMYDSVDSTRLYLPLCSIPPDTNTSAAPAAAPWGVTEAPPVTILQQRPLQEDSATRSALLRVY